MRRLPTHATLLLALVVAAGGCGSSSGTGTTAGHPTGTTSLSRPMTAAVSLEGAVRKAIVEAHHLSVEALWTNQVPANPPASGGPALATLRRSVTERRKAGVRVRTLSERFRILSVHLDPSYTTASAIVRDDQRVQPTDMNGKPHGKPVLLHEHVHLDLQRIDNTERFKVWKVVLVR